MLREIFSTKVRNHPEYIAIKTETTSLTYRQLDLATNRISNEIINITDAQQQERCLTVGLLFEHGSDMILGLISAIKVGYVYVPLDPNYPLKRLAYIVEDAEINLIITNNQNYQLAKKLKTCLQQKVMLLNIETKSSEGMIVKNNRPRLTDELAYILYTSGSTGKPKGVVQTHKNIWHFVKNYIKDFQITEADRLTLFSTFSHDAAVMDIYAGLLSGATLYPLNIKKQMNLADLAVWLKKEQITIYHSVPTVYRYFINTLTKKEQFPDLRYIILGGEALLEHDITTFLNHFQDNTTLVNLYGQSESSYNSAQLFQKGKPLNRITLGRVVDDCQIWVVNEAGQETADFEIGEIVLISDYLAKGYWKDEERTKKVFQMSPKVGRIYWTGDLGRRLLGGEIEFVGRKDFQVKIRGYRVDLPEIENRLVRHTAVEEAVVLTKEEFDGNQFLAAYVVTRENVTGASLKTYLADYLPDFMLPSYFVFLDQMPLTPTHKIDRQALPDPKKSSQKSYLQPRTELEAEIAQIWAEVLRLEVQEISIDDSFFNLGGNSLSMMNLTTILSRKFEKNVRLVDLFNNPTVEEMARLLDLIDQQSMNLEIPRLADAEWYAVSSAQRRMYILHQLEEYSTAYNLPLVFELSEALDYQQVENAIKKLVQRHEALRTSFHLVDGELFQKVNSTINSPLTTYKVEKTTPKSEVIKIVNSFIRPFDLAEAPLFRIGLIDWGEKQILLFDIYHIISDGTSNDLLITEFLQFYTGESLSPLRIQYRDFASWQNQLLESEGAKIKKDYWLSQFDPIKTSRQIPILNLPTDYPRPVRQSFAGKRTKFVISSQLTEKLHMLAEESKASLYMVLLAAYNLLFAKYCGQEDIIVGSPVAGRSRPELNQIVGMFVNTLALRNFPSGEKSFRHFLEEVKANTVKALEYQDYPFELLINQLHLERDPGRNPLFDISFRLQNFFRQNVEQQTQVLTDMQIKTFAYENLTSQFDLQLTCSENLQKIECDFQYATRLFNRETMMMMINHFLHLLEEIVRNPQRQIKDYSLLSVEEQQRLLEDCNGQQLTFARELTIQRVIEGQVLKSPDAPALVGQSIQRLATDSQLANRECLTYRQLNQRANQLAHYLYSRGVKREMVVGLLIERSLELIIGMLAIVKAGGAYLPLDPLYPNERMQYILKDSGTELLLTQRSLKLEIDFCGEMIFLDDLNFDKESDVNLENCNQPTDLIYLIYTSGSTGFPKGTMIEHLAAHNFIAGMKELIAFQPGKVIASLTTAAFDIFFLESLLPLSIGMKVVLVSDAEQHIPSRLRDLLITERVEMIQLTPSRLQIFLDHPLISQIFAQLKEVLVGGEAFPPRLHQRLQQVSAAKIYNMYGPTETTVWSAVANLTDSREVKIGRPIANTQIYILDQYQKLVPPRVIGELYIAGHGLARGYLRRSELTANRFLPNPFKISEKMYRTGDLARWLPDGQLAYIGRNDHQVKIRGYRIEVQEIENLINQYPGIQENVVIARERENGFKYLINFYVAAEEILVSDLRQHLATDLPEYMIPGIYQRIEALPLTPNGKIDRQALPELTDYRPFLESEYKEAETELEKSLTSLWAEVLRIDNIGINDNFFDLGGNSLLLVQLFQKLESKFPGKLAVVDLFAYPTISKLTNFLERQTDCSVNQEIKAYWDQELGTVIPLIVFPREYYQSQTAADESYQLSFSLDLSESTRLKQMANDLKVDLTDIVTAIYIFLLNQISGQQEVVIEVQLKDDPTKEFPLKVNFTVIKNFVQLFLLVKEKYLQAQMMIDDSLPARLRRMLSESKVIPALTIDQNFWQKDNDLLIYFENKEEHLGFICQYNGNKLSSQKIEELVKNYLELIRLVINEYAAVNVN